MFLPILKGYSWYQIRNTGVGGGCEKGSRQWPKHFGSGRMVLRAWVMVGETRGTKNFEALRICWSTTYFQRGTSGGSEVQLHLCTLAPKWQPC